MEQMETVKNNVGMSWKMVKLSSVAEVIAGQSPESKYYNVKGDGIPFFQGKADFRIDYPIVRYWCTQPTKTAMPMDILMSVRAPVGPTNICDVKACIGRGLAAIRTNDKLHYKYLYFYFKSIEEKIASQGNGSTFSAITTSVLKELQIPLPPLPIQKRIAEILDAADALKRKDQELLKKYDELAQAIFIDMFGDPLKNEKGWEVKKLKEISTKIHSGNTPKGGSNVYVKEGITFFRSQNVWKNNLVYDDIAFIDNKTHLTMMKSSLNHKDILMTKTGRINTENSSLGRAALFLGNDNTANVNGHVYLIRLQNTQVHEFVVHILTTKEYRGLIRDICVGGIDKRQLNKDHIEDFPIIYPPLVTQQKFADLLSFIKKQKQRSEVSAKKSEAIFSTLIQKAFKGELVVE